MREVVGDLSQTNHYMVSFSTLNNTLMSYIQAKIGYQEDVRLFLSRKTGLLCSEASLPTSSLATGEVRDNFMGIPQEFAHTRLYTDIDFTFYVDTNYVNLRIFESWMDYISGGSGADELSENYYRRMTYPSTYKVQTMFISKFEKDFNSQIDYQFINAFPKLVTAIPVAYGAADLLKVTVQFSYDRYIVNPRGSIKKANISEFSDIPRIANDAPPTQGIEVQNKKTKLTNDQGGTAATAGGAAADTTGATDVPEQNNVTESSAESLKPGQQAALTENTKTGWKNPHQTKQQAVARKPGGQSVTLNYSIPDGGTKFFTASDGNTYRVTRIGNNTTIYRDGGIFGNLFDVEITSTKTKAKTGNAWLWNDLRLVSQKGGMTSTDNLGGGIKFSDPQ
tara:strand:+ start:1088 stop:2266 length:1179 start_codon:yes stop_codon:yes gene_type:complete